MRDKRYYSVSFDERNYPEVLLLRARCGGMAAYGRWEALKQLLFSMGGTLSATSDAACELMARELDVEAYELPEFLEACADCRLLDEGALGRGLVVAPEVSEHLDFIAEQAERGRKGGAAKKAKAESQAKSKRL